MHPNVLLIINYKKINDQMESIVDVVKEYMSEILTVITGVIAYLAGRKKERAQLKQTEGDALKTMQDAYDRFTSDSLKRYEELAKEVLGLRNIIAQLRIELEECKKIVKN